MEKNYEDKTMFNYENYCKLIEVIGGKVKRADVDPEELDYVRNALKGFLNYVDTVDMGETQLKIVYARYDGEELRDYVTVIDKTRNIAHEAAISYVNIINRIAGFHDVGKIFEGDVQDRLAVADFCLDVTVQLFKNRKM